nr:zinc-ribbon domain containing protein [Lysobacter chinensis]
MLPEFYLDRAFTCRDCGEEQVWTARQQKWWYEQALGHIDSRAVRCRACRRARREANPGGQLLREQCERLRALATRPPDEAARRAIDEALESRWWGVRIVAIETLGCWGDRTSVARLRDLASGVERPRRSSWAFQAQVAAAKALAACLPDTEAGWMLGTGLGKHPGGGHLLAALRARPQAFWERALETEWRRADPERLIRLVWAVRWYAGGETLYSAWRPKLCDHPDGRVAAAVRLAWGTGP